MLLLASQKSDVIDRLVVVRLHRDRRARPRQGRSAPARGALRALLGATGWPDDAGTVGGGGAEHHRGCLRALPGAAGSRQQDAAWAAGHTRRLSAPWTSKRAARGLRGTPQAGRGPRLGSRTTEAKGRTLR